MQSPAAFWIASTVALTITALVFWFMIWQVMRRERRAN